MQIEQIKTLRNMRKSLEGEQLEAFLQLERSLLDVIHQERLYSHQASLKQEQQALWHKIHQLTSKDISMNFDSPVATSTTTGNYAAQTSQNAFALPAIASREYYQPPLQLPRMGVNFLTKYIPISYCYHHKQDTYPLIELIFDCKHLATDYIAEISVSFHEYSDPDVRQVHILAGSETTFFFLPLIRPRYMREITEQCHVTLYIEVRYTFPIRYRRAETRTVDFLSRNTALLWRHDKYGVLIDCTPYLAAWVTPRQPVIKKLVSEVARRIPMGQRGYSLQGNKEERKLSVREQIEAVFHVIHNQGIIYSTSSEKILPNLDSRQKVQLIRFPTEVIEHGGAANCIDGVVLFASLLEAINLHPALLLLEGHAIVGWQVFKNEREYEFLDTVLIHEGDFQKAHQKGMSHYPPKIRQKVLKRSKFGYPALIDIADCRSKHILPLDI